MNFEFRLTRCRAEKLFVVGIGQVVAQKKKRREMKLATLDEVEREMEPPG